MTVFPHWNCHLWSVRGRSYILLSRDSFSLNIDKRKFLPLTSWQTYYKMLPGDKLNNSYYLRFISSTAAVCRYGKWTTGYAWKRSCLPFWKEGR